MNEMDRRMILNPEPGGNKEEKDPGEEMGGVKGGKGKIQREKVIRYWIPAPTHTLRTYTVQ